MGKTVSGIAGLLGVLCFFLPWATVSCGSQQIARVSGYQMATGVEVQTGFSTERSDGEPVLLIVPALGVISLVFIALAGSNPTTAGGGQIAAGTLGVLVLGLKLAQMKSEAESYGLAASAQIGLIGVILSFVGLVVGGFMLIQERRRSSLDDAWGRAGSSGAQW